jgi:hypothetical protein
VVHTGNFDRRPANSIGDDVGGGGMTSSRVRGTRPSAPSCGFSERRFSTAALCGRLPVSNAGFLRDDECVSVSECGRVEAEECSRRGSNKRMGTTWAEGRMGAIVSVSYPNR